MIRAINRQSIFLALLLSWTCCFPQCDQSAANKVQLRILSWNIYMLPHVVLHTGQKERADQIVELLRNESVDVIVFEEAFDKQARKIIREGLRENFPYESGDPACNSFFRISSGVWVLSKTPLRVMKQIFFKNGRGTDRLASKGALLLQTSKQNFCFQVVATHLQSDLKRRDVKKIREKQFEKIRNELLEPCAEQDVPQFVVGDMNTMQDDSTNYQQMIRSLDVAQCSLEGEIGYSYDRTKNDIISSSDKPQLIDHIFYKSRGTQMLESKMLVKVFRKKWSTIHKDLSDHFAVLGTFTLPVKIF